MNPAPLRNPERAREALHATEGLNLGSGPHYAPGWFNVDKYDPPEGCRVPDYYADVFHLADHFPPGSFRKAYLGHFLEHLEWARIPEALGQVAGVLDLGAEVALVGPCFWKAIATSQPREILEAILADPTVPPTGHGHAWTSTTEYVRRAVEASCLVNVRVVPVPVVTRPLWPNPSIAAWQYAILAETPGGSS